ncbi:hypothetical protein CFHF_09990 [Caulobacter flavus]|uniref:Uncharacterized protein n=1 Tax=Caulobacter flavus TaxID=1679497 RepID=A0A2N5CUT0_9CAUL|nr:hypothetical protein [Caulobacter flavus]AYV45013.1 hypothetical protein C1707_01375 [Caulobacter flavus]PLR17281.1 hypothetical protein CFHF_09990 [Caulobacter flavus]
MSSQNTAATAPDPFFEVIPGHEWNACIGIQSSDEDYVDGYMQAALELAAAVIDKRQYAKRDTLAMPILYNARHAVELSLKYVIDRLVEAGVLGQAHAKNHDIRSHWAFIDDANVGDTAFRAHVQALKIFVDSLHAVDEDGQQLRYAHTQDGQKSLETKALCNLEWIRGSLLDLDRSLTAIRHCSHRLVDERRTGTFTTELSRTDLFALAAMLPPFDAWTREAITKAKDAARSRFGLSSNQLTRAINVVKAHRQMAGSLGKEFDLAHLGDADIHLIVTEWIKAHRPAKPPADDLGSDVFQMDPIDLEAIWRLSEAADAVVLAALSTEKIADLQTVYYIGSRSLFAEDYDAHLARALSAPVGSTPAEAVHHIMTKSNLPPALANSLEILGRPRQANEIRRMLSANFAG